MREEVTIKVVFYSVIMFVRADLLKMSHRYSNKARTLLQERPHLSEWLNQCGLCQRIGCKPQTPKTNENLKAHGITAPSERLRNNYDVLELDDHGICEDCRNLID